LRDEAGSKSAIGIGFSSRCEKEIFLGIRRSCSGQRSPIRKIDAKKLEFVGVKSNNDTSGEMCREQRDATTIFARNAFVAPARMQRFNTSSIRNVARRADARGECPDLGHPCSVCVAD